jgi:hypothetical protein
MITETPNRPDAALPVPGRPESTAWTLIGRITRLEIVVGAVIGAVMLALVLIEPDILEASFENEQTLLFTVGGTLLAAVAFVMMLWFRVPAVVRVIVLVVPFVLVNWWLISPYFVDDVVDEAFSTSIAEQAVAVDEVPAAGQSASDAPPAAATPPTPQEPSAPAAGEAVEQEPQPQVSAPPAGPVLLGAGQFVGLAGHSGTGDAGIFRNPDGSLVLRFENFDIENGPDLEVYLVPGSDQVSLAEGSIPLGALEGNIGDQTYELPSGTELAPGAYTALVWCEAFSVEFVGATIVV